MTPDLDRPRLPRIPSSANWGAGLALATAAISGVAIYLNAFAVRQVPDPAVYTTLKNGVAALALLALVGIGARAEVRSLRGRQWAALAVLGLIGGSVPFLLFFTGLAQATAPGAAFIHKTMFVWVALLAVPLLGERLGWVQVAALGLLLAGQLVVAAPSGMAWGSGETLIAAGTLLWSLEVIVARRLLGSGVMSSSVAAAGRMGFGMIVLLGYLAFSGRLGGMADLGAAGWAWVIVTGLLLTGFVATWYAALRRAPASVVTSILVVGAVVTAALQAFGPGVVPQPAALGGYALLAAGVALVIVLHARRGTRSGVPAARAAPVNAAG